jgi:hypothetical protein
MKNYCMLLVGLSASLSAGIFDHNIINVCDDNKIQIEDGSLWQVNEVDKHKISSFQGNDLSFRADESWFGSECYCYFINRATGDKMLVTLVSSPSGYGQNSHWVSYLEPKKSILFLDNGAIFSLYDNDREYFKNWLVDDFVITGDYYSWLSQSRHILFNYRTKEFIFGELH